VIAAVEPFDASAAGVARAAAAFDPEGELVRYLRGA
jgi:hypothetical protein